MKTFTTICNRENFLDRILSENITKIIFAFLDFATIVILKYKDVLKT